MSKIQIAWLEWMTVGGIGGVLILAGTAIHLVKKGKNKSCTQQTEGCVVRYGFPGDGRMYPIVEYAVDGICYRARKEFRGIITKKQSQRKDTNKWNDIPRKSQPIRYDIKVIGISA